MVTHYDRGERDCPNCGGKHIQKRGTGINKKTKYQRLSCMDCGSWFKGDNITLDK